MDIQSICNARFLDEKEFCVDFNSDREILPLVSITIATYQHSGYIKQCLDSILMQETSFPIEIILGEDGSSDGTREICIEYAKRYPKLIRLFLRDRNSSHLFNEEGMFVTRFNGIWNRMSARGKYVAWCEGDDYWIDSLKLQKQIDFLELNPTYNLTFHNSKVINYKSNIVTNFNSSLVEGEYYLSDLLNMGWIIPTASIVYRRESLPMMANWMFRIKSTDFLITLLLANRGKVFYFDRIMSIYRYNLPNSMSFNSIKTQKLALYNYIKLLVFFLAKEKSTLRVKSIIIYRICTNTIGVFKLLIPKYLRM